MSLAFAPARTSSDCRFGTPAPSLARFRSFDDLDDALEDIRSSTYVLAREQRPWQRTSWRLGDVLLQHVVDGAGHVGAARMAPGRSGFLVAGSAAGARFAQGRRLEENAVCRWEAGEALFTQTASPGDWWLLTASDEAIARVAPSSGEADASAGLTGVVEAPSAGWEEVRRLLGDLASSAEGRSPTHPEEENDGQLGEALLGAVLRLYLHGRRVSRGSRRNGADRGLFVARVEQYFAEHASEPVYLSALCEALGLPERTVRFVFEEQYQTGPTRVLRCRRLCQVWRALRGPLDSVRVSEVGARFGFRHLGQLAADYRALFGELPSETLDHARFTGATTVLSLARPTLVGGTQRPSAG